MMYYSDSMTLYVRTYNYNHSSGMVYTVPMCPMVHSDGTDSRDGVYGVGHGGRFGQSPCVPWYIQTGQTVGMGYVEWDMGEGLDSPHVSHGTFRRDRQWGWGIWSGTWGKVWTVPMCPMVHSDGTDSRDGVYGVGHGGRFGQSPCVPWYIQTGRTVGMGYVEWDMGEGLHGQSPCVPWYIQTGRTVGMGHMEWDMGEGLNNPHVSHGTFRRDRQWGWGMWSGTWGKVWTVPMCPMVHSDAG